MNVLTRPAVAAPAAAIAPNLPPFFTKPKNPVAAFLSLELMPLVLFTSSENLIGSLSKASATSSTQLVPLAKPILPPLFLKGLQICPPFRASSNAKFIKLDII